jgi:hypothetical protein
MSKVIVAFVSFVLGACCMSFIESGNHTSMFAQLPPSVGGAGVPKVPGLTNKYERFGMGGLMFTVDGADCTDCDFRGTVLQYGGGAFSFTRFKFAGPVRVNLTGAAANTVAFLNLVQALAASQQPPAPKPNSPILKTATLKQEMTGDFASPYGLESVTASPRQ